MASSTKLCQILCHDVHVQTRPRTSRRHKSTPGSHVSVYPYWCTPYFASLPSCRSSFVLMRSMLKSYLKWKPALEKQTQFESQSRGIPRYFRAVPKRPKRLGIILRLCCYARNDQDDLRNFQERQSGLFRGLPAEVAFADPLLPAAVTVGQLIRMALL